MANGYEMLIIEDSMQDALYYSSIIKELNLSDTKLTYAKSIAQFRNLSLSKQFNIIILDIHLPHYSGLETLQRVREIEQHSPIIILTGNTDQKLAKLTLKHGANDYLIKGIDDNKISKQMIQFWLKFSEKVYA